MYCTKCGKALEQGICPNCDNLGNSAEDSKRKKHFDRKIKSNIKYKKLKEKKSKEKKLLSKRKKVTILIGSVAALIIAGAACFLVLYFVNNAKYYDAIEMLNNDEPKAAAKQFTQLGSFKEAESYLQDCNTLMDYYIAIDTMEDESYEDAIEMFADLDGYENSKELEQVCQNHFDYETANKLFDSGDYLSAKVTFVSLGDFENSIKLADICQIRLDYAEATALYKAGDNLLALRIFQSISQYQDSADMAFKCECRLTYEEALEKIEDEKYEFALELLDDIRANINESGLDFTSVLVRKDFNDVREDCFKYVSYNRGDSYYDQGLFYSAYLEFNKAGNLLDAREKAQSCIQPIKSKEVYENPDYARNSVKMTFYAPEEGGENVCIKVYEEDGDLVSVCLVEFDGKLKIYLPSGTYYYETSYGYDWFGKIEYFGFEKFNRITFTDGDTTQRLSSSYYYWLKF